MSGRDATPEELAALNALCAAALIAGVLGRRTFSVVAPDEAGAAAAERLAVDALAQLTGSFKVSRVGVVVTVTMD